MTAADRRSQMLIALAVLAGIVAVIATVLGFQHIGGYIPCKLCLAQRVPYYVGMPFAAAAVAAAYLRWPGMIFRGLIFAAGIALLYSMALGIYHAGVEWQFWAGPTDCGATAGNISSNVNDLLGDLSATRPPSCDVAAGRFLGLSFAGWNVIASLALACLAIAGALRNTRSAA
jgi:disulfide bond formation protein DsbB